jgi:hypothetical protein
VTDETVRALVQGIDQGLTIATLLVCAFVLVWVAFEVWSTWPEKPGRKTKS